MKCFEVQGEKLIIRSGYVKDEEVKGGGGGVRGRAGPHHGLHGLHGHRRHADPAGQAQHRPPAALDGAHEDGEAEAGERSAAQDGAPVPYTAP